MLQDLATNSTDIITMFHVLEHMANLDSVIRQLWQTLRPSGLLFIEVPNILQSDASPHNIFFKAHINYFSIYTLAALTSTYFDLIAADDNGNLKMVLARRELPLEHKKLPSTTDMKIIEQRMTSKGWIEYLTKGGGFTKPFAKVANIFYEQTLPNDAKVILDNLYAEHFENC